MKLMIRNLFTQNVYSTFVQNIYCPTTQAGQTAKEKMRITQVRDDGKVNTMRTLKIEQLVEQMKKETKAQLVSNMREVLPYIPVSYTHLDVYKRQGLYNA